MHGRDSRVHQIFLHLHLSYANSITWIRVGLSQSIQDQIHSHRPDTHDLRVVLPAMTVQATSTLLTILRALDSADEYNQGRQEIDAASFGI
jgi:hypothetical protein